MPKISVILPAYNAGKTIKAAITSILSQTLDDFELLVVDDGSTDDTSRIAQQFDDPRIRLIPSPHLGVASAANIGTEQARGKYIARMDSDDYAYPHRLESQLALLKRQSLDVVGAQVHIRNSDGTPTETLQRYQGWINSETLSSAQIQALRFVEFPLVNPTILARREYFELGFHNDELPEDYDLFLRAAEAGMTFGKVPEVLLDWNDSGSRLTRKDVRYSDDAFMACRRRYLLRGPLSNSDCVDVAGGGKTGKPWVRWLQANGFSVRHIYDVNPRKIGTTIHDTPVLSPLQMSRADEVPLLIAVGAAGARETVLNHVEQYGYMSGENAWCVA